MGIVTLPRRLQTLPGTTALGDDCAIAHPGNPFFSQGDITIGTPPCWRASAASNKVINTREPTIPYLLPTQNFTILCWAKPGTTSTSLCGGGGATAGGWLLRADTFNYRIVGSTQTIPITSTANTTYVYIAVGTPSGVTVYQNGTSSGSSANANQAATGASNSFAWIMGDNTVTNRGNADIYLVAYWNRALTVGEIQQYSANPTSILVGQKRVSTSTASTGPSGSMAATESSVDVLAASGVVLIQGTANATEGTKDTTSISGKVIIQGSFAATEGTVDVFAASGTTTGGRVGTANMTEGTRDTFSGTGTILVQGSLNATENTTDIFYATNVVAPSDKCVNSKWIVNMGSSSGAIQLQMASDVNGVDVTLQEGLFFLKYRKI